ncbi:Exostosin family protein putative isoform 1 [Tripterygium wilfordii]|uniref:Exostosin family protein putative isoform 1 n=1 Tax=Tripterygium wilfordii TaxID=458696 RepID=A0A7J7DSQ8_TRIWF|nr:Exostosin family protein putative isoform 1 [Tripterygium wilfordii]
MAAASASASRSSSFAGLASIIPTLVVLALFLLFYLPSFNQNVYNTLTTNFFTTSPSPSPSSPTPTPPTYISNSSTNDTSFRKLGESKKEKSSLERIEEGLARARAAIREAARIKNYTSDKQQSYVPRGSIYRNPYAFHQSHIEMEKRFKVWVYREGELPLTHGGPMNDIYSIEGQFMSEMESEKSHFMARNPDEAHVFFIPISVVNIISYLYKPLVTYKRDQLQLVVSDYVDFVAAKYPYWNRSNGADHFLLSCHDWAPDISSANPEKYKNFIRALCNANTTEGFKPERDVSIPEINLPRGKLTPDGVKVLASNNRTIFAFFAGYIAPS